MFCNEDEGAKGGDYETEEHERIWAFLTSRRWHTGVVGSVDRTSHRLTSMDIRYNHGSLIHCLRASHSRDAPDLLAIGGEHSVAVLQVVSHFKCRISQQYDKFTGSVRDHCDANRDLQPWVQDNCDSLVVAHRFSFVLRRLVDRVSRSTDLRWLGFTLTPLL